MVSVMFLACCSISMKAQDDGTKLNQVELSKKLAGVWQLQNTKDTIEGFEMSLYKNAVVETMYRTVNGVKELTGTIGFTYDPQLDKFKGFWIQPGGRIDSYYFRFSSDKEAVWERVDDFKTNKVMARNKMTFDDENNVTGTHYDGKEVQYATTKWVRTNK